MPVRSASVVLLPRRTGQGLHVTSESSAPDGLLSLSSAAAEQMTGPAEQHVPHSPAKPYCSERSSGLPPGTTVASLSSAGGWRSCSRPFPGWSGRKHPRRPGASCCPTAQGRHSSCPRHTRHRRPCSAPGWSPSGWRAFPVDGALQRGHLAVVDEAGQRRPIEVQDIGQITRSRRIHGLGVLIRREEFEIHLDL